MQRGWQFPASEQWDYAGTRPHLAGARHPRLSPAWVCTALFHRVALPGVICYSHLLCNAVQRCVQQRQQLPRSPATDGNERKRLKLQPNPAAAAATGASTAQLSVNATSTATAANQGTMDTADASPDLLQPSQQEMTALAEKVLASQDAARRRLGDFRQIPPVVPWVRGGHHFGQRGNACILAIGEKFKLTVPFRHASDLNFAAYLLRVGGGCGAG